MKMYHKDKTAVKNEPLKKKALYLHNTTPRSLFLWTISK